jgi:hypothetical protein
MVLDIAVAAAGRERLLLLDDGEANQRVAISKRFRLLGLGSFKKRQARLLAPAICYLA